MGIGSVRCHVFDVNDLEVAEAFWSEVTGLPVIGSKWTDRFSYLGQPEPWKHEIILQLITTNKGVEPNRSHIDITPDRGVDDAIERIIAIGGSLKKEPSIYPRPGSHGAPPVIDWAVMQDPFGNEFCLVHELDDEQTQAVLEAARLNPHQSDHQWRIAAGVTHP